MFNPTFQKQVMARGGGGGGVMARGHLVLVGRACLGGGGCGGASRAVCDCRTNLPSFRKIKSVHQDLRRVSTIQVPECLSNLQDILQIKQLMSQLRVDTLHGKFQNLALNMNMLYPKSFASRYFYTIVICNGQHWTRNIYIFNIYIYVSLLSYNIYISQTFVNRWIALYHDGVGGAVVNPPYKNE